MNIVDICIISPWLLEAGTKRGGGIEEIDYQVALRLSRYFNVVILSPFYKKYSKTIYINERFSIEQVYFPAVKKYPPLKYGSSTLYINHFLMPIYSCLIIVKMMTLRKKKLKLVIVHNGRPGLLSTLLAKIMKIKVIYSEGNTIPWVSPYLTPKKKTLLRRYMPFSPQCIDKLIGNLSDRIRAQSNSIKNGMIKHGIDSAKIRVINAGVDTDIFKPLNKVNQQCNAIKVGYVGRLTDEKGASLLVEVVRMAMKELPNVHFIIMGEGPYKHHLSSLSNVEHVGWVPKDELNLWLSKVPIVLFFQKDLGLAVLEAMAAGKAIVSCDIGEVPQIITHLENGILCAPDARSYIDAIKRLCEDPSLLEEVSRMAREIAVKYFSWDVIVRDWFSLCTECLDGEGELK